jgi:hypothetical protein
MILGDWVALGLCISFIIGLAWVAFTKHDPYDRL